MFEALRKLVIEKKIIKIQRNACYCTDLFVECQKYLNLYSLSPHLVKQTCSADNYHYEFGKADHSNSFLHFQTLHGNWKEFKKKLKFNKIL